MAFAPGRARIWKAAACARPPCPHAAKQGGPESEVAGHDESRRQTWLAPRCASHARTLIALRPGARSSTFSGFRSQWISWWARRYLAWWQGWHRGGGGGVTPSGGSHWVTQHKLQQPHARRDQACAAHARASALVHMRTRPAQPPRGTARRTVARPASERQSAAQGPARSRQSPAPSKSHTLQGRAGVQ